MFEGPHGRVLRTCAFVCLFRVGLCVFSHLSGQEVHAPPVIPLTVAQGHRNRCVFIIILGWVRGRGSKFPLVFPLESNEPNKGEINTRLKEL